MDLPPMDDPAAQTCKGEPLHWDKIGQLWVCTQCGASLTYRSWNAGSVMECGFQRLPASQGPAAAVQRTYFRRRAQ